MKPYLVERALDALPPCDVEPREEADLGGLAPPGWLRLAPLPGPKPTLSQLHGARDLFVAEQRRYRQLCGHITGCVWRDETHAKWEQGR